MPLTHGTHDGTDIHHVDFCVGYEFFLACLELINLKISRDADLNHTVVAVEDIVNYKLTFHQLFLRIFVFFLDFVAQKDGQVLWVGVQAREKVKN